MIHEYNHENQKLIGFSQGKVMIAYTKPGRLQVTCGTTMLAFAQEVTFNFLLFI